MYDALQDPKHQNNSTRSTLFHYIA